MSTDPKSLLEQRLADLHEAVRHRQKDWAAALAVASDSQANLADALCREREERAALEQQLARQQAQHDIDIARAAAVRAMIDEQFHEAAREVERARLAETAAAILVEQLTLAESAAAARLAERDEQFATELSTITATRDGLEQQLSDAEVALASARERHGAAAAEIERLTRREAELASALLDSNGQLSRERNTSAERLATYQSRIEQEMAARRSVEDTLASKLSSVMGSRDSLEQQLRGLETRLMEETGSRAALEHALSNQRSTAAAAEQRFRGEIDAIVESARADRARLEDQMSGERHDHQIQLTVEQEQHRRAISTAATRLAEREEHFKTELSSITATRDRLVRQVRELQARLTEDQQQHRSALAVAATRVAEREAHFKTELASIAGSRDGLAQQLQDVEARLTQETGSRTALEQTLADLRSAAAAAEQRLRGEIDAITESARSEQARLEEQLSRERHDHEIRLTGEEEQHRSALAVAATRLAEREVQFKTELAAAEQRFRDEIRTIAGDAATECARLEEQLTKQRAQAEDRLAERRAEFEAELKRLAADHANATARLRDSIAERDWRLEERAKASATLRDQLDASENENRRQFEETPVPLIRCTRDIGVAGVNRAFGDLVGCDAHGELRDEFVAALFESRDDLIWVIERSMDTGKTESVETTCIRKDGARVAVRLSARPSAFGLVEVAAEDLTVVRVLEDKLREAHRMEAVGRLSCEIAVTCEKLLRDVYRDAQRMLTMMTDSQASHPSDTLLEDVTRVSSFLSRLVAYGHEQEAALAPVDVNRVLRDLEPVLRQVAGDAVALDLRKAASPVNVDVNAERVERLLVNVASYGRERMPHGGRLRIELSTVVVDGKFIAQHPNVRQGLHALITVTEVASAAPALSILEHASEPDARVASERPGVDLGALQELISECGGHLWITAEPGGSMVVKMRLPLRAAWESQADKQARHGLGRVTARLFGR